MRTEDTGQQAADQLEKTVERDRHRMSALAARRRANIAGWGFSAPFTAIFAVFLLVPILASLALSFTSFSIGNIQDWTSAEFVGLDNYTKLFSDDAFMKVAAQHGVLRGRRRAVHDRDRPAAGGRAQPGHRQAARALPGRLLPAGGHEHRGRRGGLALHARPGRRHPQRRARAGRDHRARTGSGNPNTTMPSIIALGVWRNIGNSMVIFLAALQTVDPQLYEAARVDGAKGRQLFRHVTVPMLRPAILFTTVITTIGYLQVFEEPFVMTGPNGGAGPVRLHRPRCSSTSRASASSTSATRARRRTRCSSSSWSWRSSSSAS